MNRNVNLSTPLCICIIPFDPTTNVLYKFSLEVFMSTISTYSPQVISSIIHDNYLDLDICIPEYSCRYVLS